MTLTVATAPVLRALLTEARSKDYPGGVLGVRAQPVWDSDPEFDHDGSPVRVVACPSALAVREALSERRPDGWLVVLTDRDDSDLGAGITAHLIGQRVRSPDLWQAVRERFQASRIDHRLVSAKGSREFALSLLTSAPADGWPPAPGGLLTPDHVYGSLATAQLGIHRTTTDIDADAVLIWASGSEAASRISALRALAGPSLADAVLDWLADRCGAIGQAVRPILRAGHPGDTVPLGLVARAVRQTPPGSGPRALLRQRHDIRVSDAVLDGWADAGEQCMKTLLYEDTDIAIALLARSETVLAEVEAEAHAVSSDLLRSSLTERLAQLGEALYAATERAEARASANGVDSILADPELLSSVEQAWIQVSAHRLAKLPDEARVPLAHAAVRLTRWLSLSAIPSGPTGFGTNVHQHRDVDAWVDRAFSDAWTGVSEQALARGLRAVLRAVRLRRDAHDTEFAGTLVAHEDAERPAPTGAQYLENVLADTVLPLAKQQPALLIVADGMSMAIATEVVEDIVRDRSAGWSECVRENEDRRTVGLALLPSLTHVSRASLLSGERTVGEQSRELDGFAHIGKTYGVSGRLFHKRPLDSSEGGFAIAHDVGAAINDIDGLRLVACVLNIIDDALDRSDPGGTEWTATTVKHLRPLLDRARAAGRVVVLTADHGHVIERREGRQIPANAMSSNRSRPAGDGPAAGDGEVRIRGRRVLLHDGDAILTVDERVRYGPLKAGYHGGAAPAEVIVPICVLAQGEPLDGWRLVPPPAPAWWRGPVGVAEIAPITATVSAPPKKARDRDAGPTLFDAEPVPPPVPTDLVSEVLASSIFTDQRSRARRLPVSDEQVANLLRALLAAPGHRLDPESAASALDLAEVQLRLAFPGVQRLLNVEQYPVLRRDLDERTIVLDEALLREQFGVRH